MFALQKCLLHIGGAKMPTFLITEFDLLKFYFHSVVRKNHSLIRNKLENYFKVWVLKLNSVALENFSLHFLYFSWSFHLRGNPWRFLALEIGGVCLWDLQWFQAYLTWCLRIDTRYNKPVTPCFRAFAVCPDAVCGSDRYSGHEFLCILSSLYPWPSVFPHPSGHSAICGI